MRDMGYYQIPELFYPKQVLGLEVTVNKYLHTKIIGCMEKKVYTSRWDNLIECLKMKKALKIH